MAPALLRALLRARVPGRARRIRSLTVDRRLRPRRRALPCLPQLLVSSPLRRQRVKPQASLTRLLASHKPKEAVIEPLLDPRDVLPGRRVSYRLVLSYAFTLTEGGKFTPSVPLTNRRARGQQRLPCVQAACLRREHACTPLCCCQLMPLCAASRCPC